MYKIITLPIILYRCKTWFFLSTEEHRLGVFKKRVLREIFGTKKQVVTGGLRKLQSEL
jgi:hypothetical protein